MRIKEVIGEAASPGATSAGNIATVVSPHIAIGQDRFKKSYTGSPGKSGTKAPKLPKVVQKKRVVWVSFLLPRSNSVLVEPAWREYRLRGSRNPVLIK